MSMNVQNISSVNYLKDSVEGIEKQLEEERIKAEEAEKEALKAKKKEALEAEKKVDLAGNTRSVTDVKKSKELIELQNTIQKEIKNIDVDSENKLLEMAVNLKNTIKDITSEMTDDDIRAVIKRQYQPEKISVDIMKRIIDHNKVAIKVEDFAKLEEEVAKSVERYKDTFSDEDQLKQIIQQLKKDNVKVDQSNIEKVQKTVDKFEQIKNLSNDEMINFMKGEKSFNLEHVYQAKFTNTIDTSRAEGLKGLESQIKNVVALNGLEVNAETIDLAKKMISNQIEFSDENVAVIKAIQGNYPEQSESGIIQKAIGNIKNRLPVAQIALSNTGGSAEKNMAVLPEKVAETLADIEKVTLGDIETAIKKNYKLNIHNLKLVHDTVAIEDKAGDNKEKNNGSLQQGKSDDVIEVQEKSENTKEIGVQRSIQGDKSFEITRVKNTAHLEEKIAEIEYKAFKTKLNLEEIRLKMTVEAAGKMAEKGIVIDTTEVQKVVDELHRIEDDAIREQGDIEGVILSDDEIETFKKTNESLSYVKLASFSAIGKVVAENIEFNLEELGSASEEDIITKAESMLSWQKEDTANAETQAIIEKAFANYEKMETSPRADLGDAIEKTFNQIDAMLEDMGLEKSEANVRAVKILAYNEMAISEEQIEAVKNVDFKVMALVDRLHPTIVLNMLGEQVSPLNMHVDDVLSYIDSFNEAYNETTFDQVAKTIFDMENNDGLVGEDKESLVSVYRMLSTIANSKGRATGFLMKNDMPIDMEHLFEAAKFIKKTKGNRELIQVDIDDHFGLMQEIKSEKPSIKGLVQKYFNQIDESTKAFLSEHNMPITKENAEMARAIRASFSNITKELFISGQNKSFEIEQFIKNEMVQLSDKMTSVIEGGGENSTIEAFKQMQEQLKHVDVETLKTFIKSDLAPNFKNLEAMIQLKDNAFSLSEQLEALKNDKSISDEYFREIRDIIDTMTVDKKEKKYDNTIDELKKYLHIMAKEVVGITGVEQQSSKAVNKFEEFSTVAKALASDDYYQIPMMINGRITQLNMYYVTEEKALEEENSNMKVYLSFKTKNIGHVSALMSIEERNMDFKIYSDRQEGLAELERFAWRFEQTLRKTIYNVRTCTVDEFKNQSPLVNDTKEERVVSRKKQNNGGFEISI